MSANGTYDVLILAAGRGPGDPMAKAFKVAHKCLVPVAGRPMLARVVEALEASGTTGRITISIDDAGAAESFLGNRANVSVIPSVNSAPGSVLSALEGPDTRWPVLVTTADHALLRPQIVDHFLDASSRSGADLTVGLADRETIMAALPNTKRTYLSFSDTQVSGCNLFALNGPAGLNFVRFWVQADKNRKKPWKLIGAFGLKPLILWLFGRLTLARAFALASARLGAAAAPVILPFAEAAVDVDKPSDKELVEEILAAGDA